jgi:hypothetical protein
LVFIAELFDGWLFMIGLHTARVNLGVQC